MEIYADEQEFMGDFEIKIRPLTLFLTIVIENVFSMTFIKTFAAPCNGRYYKTRGQTHSWPKTLSAYYKTKYLHFLF